MGQCVCNAAVSLCGRLSQAFNEQSAGEPQEVPHEAASAPKQETMRSDCHRTVATNDKYEGGYISAATSMASTERQSFEVPNEAPIQVHACPVSLPIRTSVLAPTDGDGDDVIYEDEITAGYWGTLESTSQEVAPSRRVLGELNREVNPGKEARELLGKASSLQSSSMQLRCSDASFEKCSPSPRMPTPEAARYAGEHKEEFCVKGSSRRRERRAKQKNIVAESVPQEQIPPVVEAQVGSVSKINPILMLSL